MKKLIALLLAAAMILSFAACGGTAGLPGGLGSVIPSSSPSSEPSVEPTEAPAEDTFEAPVDDPTETPVPTEDPTETPAPAEDPTETPTEEPSASASILGEYDTADFVYKNEYLGLQVKYDSAWEVDGMADLAANNGMTEEEFTEEYMSDLMKNRGSAMIFNMSEQGGLVSVNIVLEDIGDLYAATLSEKDYADISKDGAADSLTEIGYSDAVSTVETVNFAGGEHAAVVSTARTDDVDFYMTQVIWKVGRTIAVITLGSGYVDMSDEIIGMFSAL